MLSTISIRNNINLDIKIAQFTQSINGSERSLALLLLLLLLLILAGGGGVTMRYAFIFDKYKVPVCVYTPPF